MATSIPSPRREKTPSPSSTPSPSAGRRSPRPPGSPSRLLSTTPEKTTTHAYLKAKSSTSTIKSPTKPTTITKPATRKSTEIKPPSPIRKTERTLSTPTTSRERLSPKPPSPSPLPRPHFSRTNNSHPLVHKATKSLTKSKSTITGKTTNSTLITRSKSLERNKEIVAAPSAFVDNHASDTEAMDVKDEVEPIVEELDNNGDVALMHEVQGDSDNVEAGNEGKQADILVIEHENEEVNGGGGANEEVKRNEDEEKEEAIEATMPVDEIPKEPLPVPEAHTTDTEAPSRGVVVAKKEVQKSNDVIEEAKSKFLEKRKNKVLALVGAFETVMALQEPDGQQSQPQKKDKEVDEGISNANESNE